MQPPPIDPRSREQLAARITGLATELTGWRPDEREPDAGQALIAVGAWFAELVVDRLNRAPERNYLAFLNLIGVRPLPPQPARVPLTFTLAESGPAGVTVPKGTQVAAPADDPDRDEVVFETDAGLNLTRAALAAAYVHDPATDRYADRTAMATGRDPGSFGAFTADMPMPHELYIACDQILTAPGTKTVTVRLKAWESEWLWRAADPVTWSCWDGTSWRRIDRGGGDLPVERTGDNWFVIPVRLADLPPLPRRELAGVTAAWLRAALDVARLRAAKDPPVAVDRPPQEVFRLGEIRLTREPVAGRVRPRAALTNTTPIDLTGDFHPLGHAPRLADSFYVAVPEELALPGSEVSLIMRWSSRPALVPDAVWEVWDGEAWRTTEPVGLATGKEEDQIAFRLPDPFPAVELAGQRGHWLRLRMLEDFPFGPKPGKSPDSAEGRLQPPVYERLYFEHRDVVPVPASACLSRDDFAFRTHWRAADGARPRSFAPFVLEPPLGHHAAALDRHAGPALYLCFDRPFEPRLVTLYVSVDPPRPSEVIADRLAEPAQAETAEQARVVWEYQVPGGRWHPLPASDETDGLTRRGVVHFAGPPDQVEGVHFGQRGYWLRVHPHGAAPPVRPWLRLVQTNTTWATQAGTVQDELLGSGNGGPDQVFGTAQTPVLAGEQVQVREEAWVRWHPVPHLHHSRPDDRHYTVDRTTGEIRFGDGSTGRPLPRGRNNVRITYRTGGGAGGNRPAGTITQLKSGVPYVDAVTNHEPAQGGAEQESIARLSARGPQVLRHGGRAVTAQDIEDLAVGVSAEVARVRVVPPAGYDPLDQWLDPDGRRRRPGRRATDAGATTVIVVPDSDAARPVPSLGLLREVEAFLAERCPATADLLVAGPDWVEVTVRAHVVAGTPDVLDTLPGTVAAAVGAYLHPLTGGPRGDGWAFGRMPHRSELYAVIDRIDGVDHVGRLDIRREPRDVTGTVAQGVRQALGRRLAESRGRITPRVRAWLGRALVCSGQHSITADLRR